MRKFRTALGAALNFKLSYFSQNLQIIWTIPVLFLPNKWKYTGLAQGIRDSSINTSRLKVFRKIFMQNTGKHASDYPINHIKVETRPDSTGDTGINFNLILSNTFELFKKPLLWVTLMMLYINFSIQFG